MTLTTESPVGDHVDPDDTPSNQSTATPFSVIAEASLSRRGLLAGGMVAAAGFLTTSVAGAAPAAAAPATASGDYAARLGFKAIAPSKADVVHVPSGYTARPFIPWGTPLLQHAPAFVPGHPDGGVRNGNRAADQAKQVGMHHDGMYYYPMYDGPKGNAHGLLVLNHEYTDDYYLFTGEYVDGYDAAYTRDMVRKSQNAHGVSVVEIKKVDGTWQLIRGHRNRRITANTPMALVGPAAGSRLLTTDADPSGRRALGTINNCGAGRTPWGTYLTCEENFNGYFALAGESEEDFDLAKAFEREDAELIERYGVGGDRFKWGTRDPRFVVTPDDPHEPNRFGWVVEIDPADPRSTPVKRTALGRMKHEDASVHVAENGKVVVYMGDDQVFEYAYKFVSAETVTRARSLGRSPLDSGTLYVARFEADGSGVWLPLTFGRNGLTRENGFRDQADVLVKTRLAADILAATPMDRPEWTAVDPRTGTVYLTLTNNNDRTQPGVANPRNPNPWGHIVRWDEHGGDHTATRFEWDLFLLAGPGDRVDGSTIDDTDAFGSPDGLWLDPDSRAWIQTDGTQPNEVNNQMLAADPYRVDAQGRPEIRRFLTGVIGCEVTGITTTPDQKTMFINLQHPGEEGGSSWPQGDGFETPRSATVIITKNDGGVIGT